MAAPGPLGWIEPANRTAKQHLAHADAMATVPRTTNLAAADLPKGAKLILTAFWNAPEVVQALGRSYIRELQNTGSCVKVGGTNAARCTLAAQAASGLIVAVEPFMWHNYADSRHRFGDDGEGEGSMGSSFAASLEEIGIIGWPQDTADQLPDYRKVGDHIEITGQEEMRWSSIRNPAIRAVIEAAKEHKLGSAAECQDTNAIKAAVTNGYGVAFACNNYVGNGSVSGSGAEAYVRGVWDGRGGHQQWIFGYWEHPNDGPLFAVGNNWGDNTYPKDPAGLPLCCLWVKEADVTKAMRLDGEIFAYSNFNWFTPNPKVLDIGVIM